MAERGNRSSAGVAAMRRRLLNWYDRNRRDLPWRRADAANDPYKIMVSEVMLQQTQAATVVPYFERFLKAFPTAARLASAPKDRVMKLWEGLGYYARARNLQAAAKRIVADHRGKIPRDPESFSRLPGAGPYTTAAVLSIAFGVPLAAVDGNVKRVIARVRDIDRPITALDDEVGRHAQELLDPARPGDFNQAMMELGARVCAPRNPACPICPLQKYCAAFRNGTVGLRPVKTPRRSRPHRAVVAAVLTKGGRILIGRRPDKGLLGGLWEFPGGKVEPGESLDRAIKREILEELGVTISCGKPFAAVDHAYTHFSITLHGFICKIVRGNPKPLVHSELRWVTPASLSRFAMPEANRKLLNAESGIQPRK